MDFDAVVIGSGAGGGTAAYSLAKAGKKTLLIEKSTMPIDEMNHQDEHRMMILKEASYAQPFEIDAHDEKMFVGSTLGGSTSIYGGVLQRPSRRDFEPGRDYQKFLDKSLRQWPISYDDLEPYYEEIEDLYRVAGDHDSPAPHLEKRSKSYVGQLPELEPINQRLLDSFRNNGLKPFRLPLAIDFDSCRKCPICPGYYCPVAARSSSYNRCIEPAKHSFQLKVWQGVEALHFEHQRGEAQALVVRGADHQTFKVSAENYYLAAGAIHTPVILERSELGLSSGELGRNFMYHLGVAVSSLYAKDCGAAKRFTKQLGLSDFYFGTAEFPHKLGFVQAIPIPGIKTMQMKMPFRVPQRLLDWLYKRSMVFVMAIEDLPQRINRVTLNGKGQIKLSHQFHRYDLFRAQYAMNALRKTLKKASPLATLGFLAANERSHTAHQVGTCRFGHDAKRAVLDADCRVFGSENIYVVDGSFMPTSLGVGPALTIMANAMRVVRRSL